MGSRYHRVRLVVDAPEKRLNEGAEASRLLGVAECRYRKKCPHSDEGPTHHFPLGPELGT